jgi:hypothetical protein
MYHLHLTRNLRSLAFLLILAAVLAGLGGIWWVYRTGLPESWRSAIEEKAAKSGAFVRIGGLRYVLLQGIVATEVRIYSEPEKKREIARLERVIIDCDKTKLTRGEIQLNKIQLDHAQMTLPVDPKNPDSETLDITDASATVFMPGDRRLEVRDARGKIAGIDVALDARILWFLPTDSPPPDESHLAKRRQLMEKILSELGKWQFDAQHPPAVQIRIEGDVNDFSTLTAKLGLQVKRIGKNDYVLDEVTAEAEMVGDLLTVSSLRATDAHGVCGGHIDYNLSRHEGRFDVYSSLEVPDLLTAWLGVRMPKDLLLGGKQVLEAEGDFTMDERNVPQIRLTGHVRCDWVTLRGAGFESLESAFSWRDGKLFLRDVKLVRGDGRAEAKAMIEWPVVQLEVHSTLPVPIYQRLVAGIKQPIETILNDFSEREGAVVEFTAAGSFDANNHLAWAYTGHGSAKNISYRGIPANAAQCKFNLNHYELDFYDGSATFDYAKYSLRKAFSGAESGSAKIGRIRYNAPEKLIEVENVRGAMWAAPVVRMFAAKVADSLEIYRFHQPPEMTASGVVDVTPQGRTALDLTFRSEQPADYVFLGENLTLEHPSGQVVMRGERVTVKNLRVDACGGPIAATIDYLGSGKLKGEVNWTKLSIPELTTTYGFQMKGGGTTTGRIDFSLTDGKVETMAGEGLIALEKAELFSVPMFGPLSSVIGGVLNDEKAGYERAKNAFCTYKIENGVVMTNDFQTATHSLNFTGDGSLDMRDRTLDMTMRMNARGFLLGLITLPLRPFAGLFQFHGTGPLKSTKWENMMFTAPPESQRKILQEVPRAKAVGEGR